jgi:hypothetical protein
MPKEELPPMWGIGKKLQDERITHSICPDCSNVA